MYDLFIFNIFGYSPHSTRHMSVRSCIFDSTCSLGSPMYTVYKHLTTVHIYKIVDIIHYIHHNIHTNSYAVTVTVTAIHIGWLMTHDRSTLHTGCKAFNCATIQARCTLGYHQMTICLVLIYRNDGVYWNQGWNLHKRAGAKLLRLRIAAALSVVQGTRRPLGEELEARKRLFLIDWDWKKTKSAC